jgi:outer membrane protein assembly factor BamB
MLDDSYFKRAPWRMGGEYARLLVHDDRNAFYVRQFDSMRGLDPSVYFTPGSKGYMLFSKNTKKGKRQWFQRVPVRIRAMVQTSDVLFVAGPPDAIPDEDPLGPYEGRYGGKLHAIDASTGEKLGEYELASPPVFNGIAAVPGRLYITEKDGFVSCYAGKKPGGRRASK